MGERSRRQCLPFARSRKGSPVPLANAEAFLPPHIHSPSVKQWNASVQHRLSDNWVVPVSYLGNQTSHLWIGNEINPAVYTPGTCSGKPCSSTSNPQARRVLSLLNPAAGHYYSQMTLGDDGISANYNGLLTSVEHRFAKHYTLLVTYTCSKCLGVAPVTSLGTGVLQDPNNVRGDYGLCSYDAPHLFNASLSQWNGGGIAGRLLNHWNVAPLIRYQSGLPVNPASGKDNSLTGVGNDRPDVVSTTAYTGPPHGLLYQFLNPGLFGPNATGKFGNAGHNDLRAPGYFDVDVAVDA